MLFVSVFTFIGLPTAQTFASFSNEFDASEFAIDFGSEEEESERSNNETKEFENKLINKQENCAIAQSNLLNALMLHDHLLSYSSIIYEVKTPPPEYVIA